MGGLSGSPLSQRAEHCLQVANRTLGGRLPIISVGGVMSADACKQRISLGATLVQLYTGLIYQGPGLVKDAIRITR